MRASLTRQATCVSLYVFVVGLAGCATGQPGIEEITKDGDAYLGREFAVQKVPAAIIDRIIDTDTETPYEGRIVESFEVTIVNAEGQETKARVLDTLVNMENGIFEVTHESRTDNDVPFVKDFSISYRGLIPIKFQRVLLQRGLVPMERGHRDDSQGRPVEMKKLLHFDAVTGHPQASTEYDFVYSLHGRTGDSGYYETKCKSGTYYEASAINPILAGRAVDFRCTSSSQHAAHSAPARLFDYEEKYAFLEKYGVMEMLEHNTAQTKQRIRLLRFEVFLKELPTGADLRFRTLAAVYPAALVSVLLRKIPEDALANMGSVLAGVSEADRESVREALAKVSPSKFQQVLAWSDLESRGTLAGLGVIRRALLTYHDDEHVAKFPSELSDLIIAGAPRYGVLPLARTDHPSSSSVISACSASALTDAGGWAYCADPKSKEYGTVWVNCTHRDARGIKWFWY